MGAGMGAGMGDRGGLGRDGAGPPQLLDQVFAFLDDVHGHLQGGLLLLAEALAEVLHGLHGLGVHVVQQLLLQLLQPCPQLRGQRREGPCPAARGGGPGAAAPREPEGRRTAREAPHAASRPAEDRAGREVKEQTGSRPGGLSQRRERKGVGSRGPSRHNHAQEEMEKTLRWPEPLLNGTGILPRAF